MSRLVGVERQHSENVIQFQCVAMMEMLHILIFSVHIFAYLRQAGRLCIKLPTLAMYTEQNGPIELCLHAWDCMHYVITILS